MKVLVTGGAGFIGSNLCRRLLDEESITEVRVIDDLSTGFKDNLDGVDVTMIEASILDRGALAQATSGIDAVVHLAALGSVPRSVADPGATHDANATGTLRVLERARDENAAHVVLASSSSVYGANPVMPKIETLQCMPMSPYAVTKLATEQYAMAFAACYDLPVLPFRFFNVYGPRQRAGHVYAAVIPAFLQQALNGAPLRITGDGTQSRDFTYVGTVAEIITAAIVSKVSASPTNLAFGTRTSLIDLVATLEVLLGHSIAVEHVADRPGDVKHSQADNTKLKSLFPEATAAPLGVGLEETIAWYQDHLRFS